MEIAKPKSNKKCKPRRQKMSSESKEDEENIQSDIEPISNLSASVDISGELLNAAIEIIDEPFDKNEVVADNANITDSFDELDISVVDDDVKDTKEILQELKDDDINEEVESLEEESVSNSGHVKDEEDTKEGNEMKNAELQSLISDKETAKAVTLKDTKEQLKDCLNINSNIYPTIEMPLIIQESETTEELGEASNELIKMPKQLIDTPKEPTHITKELINVSIIKAYTEQQLSALYLNDELQLLEQFTNQFVEAELRGTTIKQHVLYDLLTNYLNVRNKIVGNSLEIEQLRKETAETQNLLWNMESAVVSGRGECQDGVPVQASHTYTRATFQRSSYQNIARTLASIRTLSNESHTLHSYSAEVYKIQIDSYINNLTLNCIHHSGLPPDAAVLLNFQNITAYLNQFLCDLRLCISILFSFQRKLIRDTTFMKETRQWLSQLIGILLRMANWQDHLFIINHILRCPAGVGNWAASFIQSPLNVRNDNSPFANREINHIVTVMLLLLMPISSRYQFLQDLCQNADAGNEKWIVVDSDGEEDDDSQGGLLHENDLVAFFNQLPLDNIFRMLLGIVERNNEDYYMKEAISEYHILKFYAFSTTLIKILHRGLQHYNQPRYNQFSKRLSRLIRHIVQYATDQWELFQTNQTLEDTAMMKRLQVEYDAFFLRATHYLYLSQKLGAWQFLAIVPYNHVSLKTLWKIYYLLHNLDTAIEVILDPLDDTDYEKKLWDSYVRTQFQEKIINLTDDECYYLLNTFTNMALARNEDEINFIKATIKDLIEVGFICEATQEMCSKNARILLTNLTSKYPYLLSDILQLVRDNIFTISTLALQLYEELPLSVWSLNDTDFNILSKWLTQCSVTSTESCLSRMIISRLNWDISSDGVLFLPYDLHCRVALLVAEIVQLDSTYELWGWHTLFRLKLHYNDKGVKNLSIIKEPDYYNVILKGMKERQPISSFLTILMTTWGHLIPLVCSNGLKQLLFLQVNQQYDASILGLFLIVPLFIECQESLINCEPFQEALSGIINADRTYVNMAKSIISSQNTILEHLGYMIEYQIANYWWYNLHSPRCLVRLWLNSLVSIQKWNKDVGVMYLIDIIIRASFFYTDARDVIYNILKDLLQCTTPQEQSNSISSLFKWVSTSNNKNNLLINGSLSTCTYLAYILIELEYEEREKVTGLWDLILIQLTNQKGKVNVDAAIKKATSNLKLPSFTSTYLTIFRWAQQALDTPLSHPLLPLLWQKFFTLYLYRVSSGRGLDQGCVGTKFFEGLINVTFFKRIKKRLQETLDYYGQQLEEHKEIDENHIKVTFYAHCKKLFQAYSLWLEETRLQEANLYLPSLPAQYEPQLLTLVLQASSSPWMEYVDAAKIQEDENNAIKSFKSYNYRERKNINMPLTNVRCTIESADPLQRILRRLHSYDTPKLAPSIIQSQSSIPNLNFVNNEQMYAALKPHFDTIIQFAKNYNLKCSEHNTLDCMYLELVPQLYRSVLHKVKKQVTCKGSTKAVLCSGAANILLQMQEARINERIEHQVQMNRNDYESLLKKVLQAPAVSLCVSSVVIQNTINLLKINPDYSSMGVDLFYYLLTLLSEENINFLPAKQLFTLCLERLGRNHIYENESETPRLLDKILEEKSLCEYLTPHFAPDNVGTANFLLMYSNISKDIGQKHDLIFTLLSKFDVPKWLNVKQPKLKQRSQFIELVVKSLTKIGISIPKESSMLFELYRRHLLFIFEYQFPEHLGEILMHMLKVSNGGNDSECIATIVWMDLLNFLSKPIELNLVVSLRDQMRLYAQQQKLLHYQELLEMTDMLSRHFHQERLQYGLYGLYPKVRNYIDVFVLLLGMTGHALIISCLNTHEGQLGEKLCEIIWPKLRELFSPWLIPYLIPNIKDDVANWIQQLADDRTVLLPWIAADGPYAQKIVKMFFECIFFITQTLPGSNKILSLVWQWYVTCFAHTTVKDHITNAIHASFLDLPWKNFWPTVGDLEMMLKVIEQHLPESHVFLACIFMELPWTLWLRTVLANTQVHMKTRIQHCLLHLVVKLTNEPNIKKNHTDKAKALITEATNFNWCFVEVDTVQQVMDWYVMSCDPLVIFKTDPFDLDFMILRFLQIVAYYDRIIDYKSSNQIKKRHLYVRSYIKLIAMYASRYKATVNSKETDFNNLISYQLNYIEQVVENVDELKVLLSEFFEILNQSIINKMAIKTFVDWISNKSSHGNEIKAVLQILASSVCDMGISATLFETTINSYFNNNVTHKYVWSDITSEIKLFLPKQNELEFALIKKGCVLTLHAIMLKKMENVKDIRTLLENGIEWLTQLKITDTIESQVPLLWVDILTLTLRYCNIDEPCTGAFLHKFVQILIPYSDEMDVPRWGRGILGAIGIVKNSSVSLKFKFLCRALGGYVLAQLPEMKGNPQCVRHVPNAPSIVGHPGGNNECAKILLKLDFGQSQGQIKDCAEMALRQIQDPANSLHNVRDFLIQLLNQMYMKPYLTDLIE